MTYFIKASYGSNWVVELPQIESTYIYIIYNIYITLHRFSMKVLRGFASFSKARFKNMFLKKPRKHQLNASKSSQKSRAAQNATFAMDDWPSVQPFRSPFLITIFHLHQLEPQIGGQGIYISTKIIMICVWFIPAGVPPSQQQKSPFCCFFSPRLWLHLPWVPRIAMYDCSWSNDVHPERRTNVLRPWMDTVDASEIREKKTPQLYKTL